MWLKGHYTEPSTSAGSNFSFSNHEKKTQPFFARTLCHAGLQPINRNSGVDHLGVKTLIQRREIWKAIIAPLTDYFSRSAFKREPA